MTIEWNKVTWYSKALAVVVFLATFAVAFSLGMRYGQVEAWQTPSTMPTQDGGGGGGGILPYHSGVEGTVSLGPTCPVERIPPDPACADKPYQGEVEAYRRGSEHIFATAKTTTGGTYQISLPPGDYTVSAGAGSMLPRCSPVEVTIAPEAYAHADISCDTGIR